MPDLLAGLEGVQPACAKDPDLWFSEAVGKQKKAAAICQPCPIRLACLQTGMTEAYGTWGGLTVQDRQRVLGRTYEDTNPLPGWTGPYCPSCNATAENLTPYAREGGRWQDIGLTCDLCAFTWRTTYGARWVTKRRKAA